MTTYIMKSELLNAISVSICIKLTSNVCALYNLHTQADTFIQSKLSVTVCS